MILPITTTSYTPVYIFQDSSSDTQRCLERSENADILQKTLKEEELTDAETQRITACVEERKEANNTIATVVVIVAILLVIGLVVVCAIV